LNNRTSSNSFRTSSISSA